MLNKTYTFVRKRCHPKVKHLQDWYLELKPSDLDTMDILHEGFATRAIRGAIDNPHDYTVVNDEVLIRSSTCYECGRERGVDDHNFHAVMYHPIIQSAKWLTTAINCLLFRKETIYVNSNGGITFKSKGERFLGRIESDKIVWPDEYDPKEIITISRYPDAKHYYLSSSKDRLFAPSKYNKASDAYDMALNYVKKSQIMSKM